MHAHYLVELAAIAAEHGASLIRSRQRLSLACMELYWTSSKCRLDRWMRALKTFHLHVQRAGYRDRPALWRQAMPLLEEILASEVLTRVWTAIVCGYDARRGQHDAAPVARSVFLGHAEARNRTLNLMVYGQGIPADDAAKLNRLRRRSERWTDLLLGCLVHDCDVSETAFDADRAHEFAADLREPSPRDAEHYVWALLTASLRSAFSPRLAAPDAAAHEAHPHEPIAASPNADLNERIAAGVLSCFGPELCDSFGRIRSAWQLRMSATTRDAQGMLTELLALDGPPAAGRDRPNKRLPGGASEENSAKHTPRF